MILLIFHLLFLIVSTSLQKIRFLAIFFQVRLWMTSVAGLLGYPAELPERVARLLLAVALRSVTLWIV